MPRKKKSGREPSLGGQHSADESPKLGGDSDIPHLLEIIRGTGDRRPWQVLQAMRTLEALVIREEVALHDLIEMWPTSGSVKMRHAVLLRVMHLPNLPADALSTLLRSVHDQDEDFRILAVSYLSSLRGAPHIDAYLLEALHDPSPYVAAYAARSLAATNHPQGLETLLDMVRSQADQARHAAVIALGYVPLTDDVLRVLFERLADDLLPSIRETAAVSLGELGSLEAVGVLIRALADPDNYVAAGAAQALGKIGDRKAVGPLIGVMRRSVVGSKAVMALGWLRDERAVSHLAAVLRDGSAPVDSRFLVAVLKQFDTPEALEAVREYEARQERGTDA